MRRDVLSRPAFLAGAGAALALVRAPRAAGARSATKIKRFTDTLAALPEGRAGRL